MRQFKRYSTQTCIMSKCHHKVHFNDDLSRKSPLLHQDLNPQPSNRRLLVDLLIYHFAPFGIVGRAEVTKTTSSIIHSLYNI